MQMVSHFIEGDSENYIDQEKFPDIPLKPLEGYEPCRFTHPTTTSCIKGSFKYFFGSLHRSYKLYIPFNLMVTLLLKRKCKQPLILMKEYLISCTRSSIFLTLYSWITLSSICLFNYIGLNCLNKAGFSGFLCGLSVIAERKPRRIELGLYCFPRAIQIVWNMLKKKKKVKPIPFGEFIFLSGTFGTLFWLYQWEKESINSHHLSLLNFFLGSN